MKRLSCCVQRLNPTRTAACWKTTQTLATFRCPECHLRNPQRKGPCSSTSRKPSHHSRRLTSGFQLRAGGLRALAPVLLHQAAVAIVCLQHRCTWALLYACVVCVLCVLCVCCVCVCVCCVCMCVLSTSISLSLSSLSVSLFYCLYKGGRTDLFQGHVHKKGQFGPMTNGPNHPFEEPPLQKLRRKQIHKTIHTHQTLTLASNPSPSRLQQKRKRKQKQGGREQEPTTAMPRELITLQVGQCGNQSEFSRFESAWVVLLMLCSLCFAW